MRIINTTMGSVSDKMALKTCLIILGKFPRIDDVIEHGDFYFEIDGGLPISFHVRVSRFRGDIIFRFKRIDANKAP